MKLLDKPQSGKLGLIVSQDGAFGLVQRALAIPSNPRTPAQMSVRENMSRISAEWRGLTEEQRAAWCEAATNVKSETRLGQNGSLSGFLLFTKINCTLAQFGQPEVNTPPAPPEFPALAPQNLTITNTGGTIALKLTCPSDPGENTIVRASRSVSAGRQTWSGFRIIGICPAADQGAADITGLYTARFGAPTVGSKVYVQVNQFVNGWESVPRTFVAIVPEAS